MLTWTVSVALSLQYGKKVVSVAPSLQYGDVDCMCSAESTERLCGIKLYLHCVVYGFVVWCFE